jgi:nucleoside-diphosphate-sugar epimerase
MKNRILITGSNSFVGREIINYLSKYNYNLIATYRKNKNEFKSKKVKLVKFDLKKKLNLNKRFGVLVHCASVTPANEFRENYYKINQIGFKNLISLCLKSKCNKIILISSVAVYGDVKKTITEKSFARGKSKYAKSKLKMENILFRFAKKNKINSVVLRLSQVIGSKSVNNYFSDLKKKIHSNKKITISLQSKKDYFNNLCHINDLCINIKKLIDGNIILNKNEVFNFASNKPITINKFKKIIYSYNKKIQFVENNIPKFYKISLNKTNKYNLKFRSTLRAIKSSLN